MTVLIWIFFKIIAMQVKHLWNSCIRKCYERALNIFFYISTYILLMIFEFSLSKWETWHFSNNFSFCKFNVYKNCWCCLLWKLVFHKKFDGEGICVCKTNCLCLEILENFFCQFWPKFESKILDVTSTWGPFENHLLISTKLLQINFCFKVCTIFMLTFFILFKKESLLVNTN